MEILAEYLSVDTFRIRSDAAIFYTSCYSSACLHRQAADHRLGRGLDSVHDGIGKFLELVDDVLEKAQAADKFGSGFQRHFIYSIIRIANDYMPVTAGTKSKDFVPSMNLLLFEEPEAFLHPPQQMHLCRDLIQLSKSDNWQVLATTHSSHFVSKSTDMLPSLIHLTKSDGVTTIHQILQEDWDDIVTNNGMIDDLAKSILTSRIH